MIGIIFWSLIVVVLFIAYRKAEQTVKTMDQQDKRQSETQGEQKQIEEE